jgi:YidC/Oxa1 family membrane protein insertase
VNIFELIIVQPLFNLLLLLQTFIPGGDFGITIILFTVLLRLIMYPLVKRQLHQTKAMRKLQPELEAIKRRTKGNKQQEGVEMMELYKRHGVSPFRSFGILIIQLPIFIALYLTIRIFSLQRDQLSKWTYHFLQNIGPIKHVIEHPSAFNEKLFGVVDLTQYAFSPKGISIAIVILALIAAIGQFYQSKQTLPQSSNQRKLREIFSAAANGKDADQSDINSAVMGKMIYALPVFMLFVMLRLPGAIALYYATTTVVAVIQQAIVLREDEEEMEEIADEKPQVTAKKATAKAQARAEMAQEASVTRIVAKSTKPSKSKHRGKGGKR